MFSLENNWCLNFLSSWKFWLKRTMRNEFDAKWFYVATGYLLFSLSYITSLNSFFSVFSFLNIGILLEKLNWSTVSWTWLQAIFEKSILSLDHVPRVATSIASFCNIRSQFDCIHGGWGIRGRITPLLMSHVYTKSFEYKRWICFHYWT